MGLHLPAKPDNYSSVFSWADGGTAVAFTPCLCDGFSRGGGVPGPEMSTKPCPCSRVIRGHSAGGLSTTAPCWWCWVLDKASHRPAGSDTRIQLVWRPFVYVRWHQLLRRTPNLCPEAWHWHPDKSLCFDIKAKCILEAWPFFSLSVLPPSFFFLSLWRWCQWTYLAFGKVTILTWHTDSKSTGRTKHMKEDKCVLWEGQQSFGFQCCITDMQKKVIFFWSAI